MDSPHKGSIAWKAFPCHYVFMYIPSKSWLYSNCFCLYFSCFLAWASFSVIPETPDDSICRIVCSNRRQLFFDFSAARSWACNRFRSFSADEMNTNSPYVASLWVRDVVWIWVWVWLSSNKCKQITRLHSLVWCLYCGKKWNAPVLNFNAWCQCLPPHDDVIEWKYFYAFVRGIHRSPVNSRIIIIV